MLLQQLAAAVAGNHPECHLMVVLLDERPEEVTDMRRSVRGEVLASTFDRAPKQHIALAELAVERAKRLVEAGQDVVILLDSLTRLCRAHNNAAAAGGRTLSGGVDAAALAGPKRLFGAARLAEEGGSLTILATALVETGSRADDFYFEELKSTGNMELRLDRTLASGGSIPAVDITPSGTRREELLVPASELAAVRGLRRALHSRGDAQADLETLLERMRGHAGQRHVPAAGPAHRARRPVSLPHPQGRTTTLDAPLRHLGAQCRGSAPVTGDVPRAFLRLRYDLRTLLPCRRLLLRRLAGRRAGLRTEPSRGTYRSRRLHRVCRRRAARAAPGGLAADGAVPVRDAGSAHAPGRPRCPPERLRPVVAGGRRRHR